MRSVPTVCLLLLCTLAPAADLAFLGPRGSFSEAAAKRFAELASEPGDLRVLGTITAVAEAVRDGSIPFGVLPVASTSAGFPAESMRVLLASRDPGFRIHGEVAVPVDLHVLAPAGTRREQIRKIVSHPSALKEASQFLRNRYPGVPLEETASTSAAAALAARAGGSVAAVASSAAGALLGLESLDRNIQDNRDNATSFWKIARTDSRMLDATPRHLVLLLETPPASDAFSAAVSQLFRAGFSLVFVHSTPASGPLYGFRYLASFRAGSPRSLARVERELRRIRSDRVSALTLGAWR